jgi:anti-sigma B factor antagonist
MEITEETRGGALLVQLAGRLDSHAAASLEAMLPQRVRTHPVVVLNLAEVAYVSSAGLRVLLKGATLAKPRGGKLVLTGLSPEVREVFDISGFTASFTIHATAEEGLAAHA